MHAVRQGVLWDVGQDEVWRRNYDQLEKERLRAASRAAEEEEQAEQWQ